MVSIFELNSEGTSVLIGTIQVSVAEMKAGAIEQPQRRYALVNHEGAETGFLAFLGADASQAPASPQSPGIPGEVRSEGMSITVTDGADSSPGSPGSGLFSPVAAAAATYPKQGRLKQPSPPPPPAWAMGGVEGVPSTTKTSPGAASGAGDVAADEAAAAASARLNELWTKIREMEQTCQTAADANARAKREVQWREELQAAQAGLRAEAETAKARLQEEESARLRAIRRAEEAQEEVKLLRARLTEAEAVRGPSPRTAAAGADKLRRAEAAVTAAQEEAQRAKEDAAVLRKRLTAAEADTAAAKSQATQVQSSADEAVAKAEREVREAVEQADSAASGESAAQARLVATAQAVAQGFVAAAASLGLSTAAGESDDAAEALPAGIPPAVLTSDWDTWDAALLAAAVEAVASAAIRRSRRRSSSVAPAGDDNDMEGALGALVAEAEELRSRLAQQDADHAKTVQDKNKLVREWEKYANHWEKRGRDAEKACKQLEAALEETKQRVMSAVQARQSLDAEVASLRSALAGRSGTSGADFRANGAAGGPVLHPPTVPTRAATDFTSYRIPGASPRTTGYALPSRRPPPPAGADASRIAGADASSSLPAQQPTSPRYDSPPAGAPSSAWSRSATPVASSTLGPTSPSSRPSRTHSTSPTRHAAAAQRLYGHSSPPRQDEADVEEGIVAFGARAALPGSGSASEAFYASQRHTGLSSSTLTPHAYQPPQPPGEPSTSAVRITISQRTDQLQIAQQPPSDGSSAGHHAQRPAVQATARRRTPATSVLNPSIYGTVTASALSADRQHLGTAVGEHRRY